MLALIIAALFIWAVCIILGFAIKTVFWLAIVGMVMFVVTIAAAVIRGVFESER